MTLNEEWWSREIDYIGGKWQEEIRWDQKRNGKWSKESMGSMQEDRSLGQMCNV